MKKRDKITISLLSDQVINKIQNLGGVFTMASHTPDLLNIAYTVKFNNGYQVGIGKAMTKFGDTFIEVTDGALDDLWDTCILKSANPDDGEYRGGLTESDLLDLCKEVSSHE